MTEVFAPEWGNPSLRTIIEAKFPEEVSLIPSTPGWWLVLLLVLGLAARAIWRHRQRYLRDSYRREAMTELADIRNRLGAGTMAAARELAPLLRATAIAAAGREAIAGLRGEAYSEALAALTPKKESVPIADLQQLAYAPIDDLDAKGIEPLIASVELWIRKHEVPDA